MEAIAVLDPQRPFLATRVITSSIFALIAIGLAIRGTADKASSQAGLPAGDAAAGNNDARICQVAFLTVAWFWLLVPDSESLVLDVGVAILAVHAQSGRGSRSADWLLLYYFRFWFEYHYSGVDVLGTGYTGTLFFDFVVVWIEFAPWFVWLAIFSFVALPRELPDAGVHVPDVDESHRGIASSRSSFEK